MRVCHLDLRLIPASKKKGRSGSSQQVSCRAGSSLPPFPRLSSTFFRPEGGEQRPRVDGGGVRDGGLLGISGATLSPRGKSDKASSPVGEPEEPAIPERKERFVGAENSEVLQKDPEAKLKKIALMVDGQLERPRAL